ncbi:MFS multidrug transporter [Boeremia exigua]|uniref:MFS multidrug transporter n=1 Tax=Boeremia exigua TaxID=749465 RepID=UPI001E8E75B0|nr:MFS multidrug transporter [Boeremia exigua]KAH6618445.1 MFS multidrug transporter [Boeremia exigua]
MTSLNCTVHPFHSTIKMKAATTINMIGAGHNKSCREEHCHGLRAEVDIDDLGVTILPNGLVTWNNNSPDHPRNWTPVRKAYDIGVVATMEFFTTVVSTTGPSAAALARTEYETQPMVTLIAFTLMYQLGQALGGLIVPPYSEVFGRKKPYILAGGMFCLFCLLMAVVPSITMVYIGRFITGFASAVPSVVLAGSVEDLFNSRQRVWFVLLWNSLATAGLVFGPILGVYVSLNRGWRWIYYISAVVMAALTVATLFIRESRPSLLLSKKVATIRKRTGQDLKFDNPDAVASHARLIDVVLIRPATLLVSEPLVILVSTLSSVSWAIIYLFTEALTGIYESMGFYRASASLPFLAIGLGVLFSIFPRYFDVRAARKRKERGEPLEPEDKLTGFLLAVPSLAIGLWWFAWCIPPAVTTIHWIVPTFGLIFVGFAVNEMAYTLSSYLADSYTVYAASAFAALAFVRALISGLMPLIAYAMYSNLSANAATTIIAVLSTLFGIAPYIMVRYSKKLRGMSKFAKYSLDVHERTRIEVD